MASGSTRSTRCCAGLRMCLVEGHLGQGSCFCRYGAGPGPDAVPVRAGSPAKQATWWMAPASPVFAGEPAPTLNRANVRGAGQGSCFCRYGAGPGPDAVPVRAGSPAKQATWWMAPASPVFAGEPAPTLNRANVRGAGQGSCFCRYGAGLGRMLSLWERVHPRSRQRGAWHRLRIPAYSVASATPWSSPRNPPLWCCHNRA